ncbi:hypothetical protein KR009_006371 [Drosophila setifemur]|nr:hypothetical protein KR009_006371 [Drosophila setifemur]
MSRAAFSSYGPGRMPGGDTMLRLLESSELAAEEASLEFYEDWNVAWRAQYEHPSLAALGVGVEFAPRKSRKSRSALSTQDDDSENQVIGNSSSSMRLEPTTQLPLPVFEYLAHLAESEDENLMHFFA